MASSRKKTPAWLTALYVAGMSITGSINTLSTKLQFQLHSLGKDGEEETFRKPWFGTFNMLFAMASVSSVERLVTACTASCCGAAPQMMAESSKEGSSPKPGEEKGRKRKIAMVAVPAASDLLATALAAIGIMYIPASVWQMSRGATSFFTGIFSVIFSKRRSQAFHWIGLMSCMAGVVTVGYASVAGDTGGEGAAAKANASAVLFGVTSTLSGQVVQAAQVISEEFLMKDVNLPAVEIIGFEWIWGVSMMVVVVYPASWLIPGPDHGHQEDSVDTSVMFYNSSVVQSVVIIYLFSCGTFNITGIAVTGALSAVHRMMSDASRTMIIWGVGLFVHYQIDPASPFGEQWTDSSQSQLFGFMILITGQAIYGEIIRIPGVRYRTVSEDSTKFASPSASLHFASPAVGPVG